MASYKGTYSNEQSLNFVIPIIVILFLGIIYVMTQRADSGFVSFILIGAAAITMFYWVRVLKKMTKDQAPTYSQVREQETKNWVYDLIKGEGEFVFVAEVPGPEDKIAVRLMSFEFLHIIPLICEPYIDILSFLGFSDISSGMRLSSSFK